MSRGLGRPALRLGAALALAGGIWAAAGLARWARQAPARRHFQAGLAAVEGGRPQDAEREWREAIRLSPGYLPPYRLLAGLYLSTGLWRKGDEILERFRAVAPQEPHLECQLAETALYLERLPEAEAHARRELRRDPACGQAHLVLGRVMIARKNEREAVAHLREAVRRMPGEIDPPIYLAQAYIENMRLAEAQAVLIPLLARHPDLGHAAYMLGFCHARSAAEPDGARKAEVCLRRALARNPRDEGALCELGRLDLLWGRSGAAVPLLQAAARAAPGYPPTFYHLARAYRAQHEEAAARRAEARFLTLNRLAMEESALVQRHGIVPADPRVRDRLAELRVALSETPAPQGSGDDQVRRFPTKDTKTQRTQRRATGATGASAPPAPAAANAPFVDVARAAGVRFRHSNGARGAHTFVETTGSGCAMFDYDNDGRPDLLLLQAGPLPGTPERRRVDAAHSVQNRLYHNRGDGTFADVTAGSGLEATGYSQGVAVGDWDNDGFDDLYITAYGGNHLFHNERGTGRFADVTHRARVANTEAGPRWSTSAAFGDYDGDGNLDLFVCHYVKWSPSADQPCRDARGHSSYCHPHVYDGDTMTLYRNNGSGTFTDVTRAAGLAGLVGRGLGVTWLDENGDGRPDLYIANDLTPNFLLRNNGDGTFTDVALEAGVAVSDSGTLLSGMGVAPGDYDGDGREDLFVTNFSKQGNSLYHNDGGGTFSNRAYASGIGTISLNWLGFGCAFLDEDLDGRLDLLVANGHVMDDVALTEREITYAERKSLYHNRGDGTFVDVAAGAGDLAVPRVSRGLAVGDFDSDGAMDALVNNQNDAPQLLRGTARNRFPERHWLELLPRGTRDNRDGYHARVTVRAGGRVQLREVRSAFSYCSASDRRVHFGLGAAAAAESMTIRWSGGHIDRFPRVPADRVYVVTEGGGIHPL